MLHSFYLELRERNIDKTEFVVFSQPAIFSELKVFSNADKLFPFGRRTNIETLFPL